METLEVYFGRVELVVALAGYSSQASALAGVSNRDQSQEESQEKFSAVSF